MVHLNGATLLLAAPIYFANAGSLTFLKATKHHQHGEMNAEFSHRGECWEHRPVHKRFHKSFIQQTPHTLQEPQMALPGAGMHPEDIEPFQMVTKDGFLMTACVKDAMLEHGDKFGNNKFKYKFESTSNVSVVHYAEIIPKEDRKQMTIDRCFDFCRTVPNMVYFGLHAGRDCYCTPYYKPMPGDSSNCDETCEGDPSQMCGGKVQSSVFEMHSCANTRSELEDIITEVEDKIFYHFQDLADQLKDVADQGQNDAVALQKVFGAAGDPDTSNYMQQVKVYSGELLKAVTDAHNLIDLMQDPYDAARISMRRNLRNFDNIKVAEDAIAELKDGIAAAAKITDVMDNHLKVAHPTSVVTDGEYNVTAAAIQYYPIMYFVDDEFKVRFVDFGHPMWVAPTTCTGNLLQIVFGGVMGDCAHACDQYPGKCDGFQFLDFADGMCLLFESIKTVQQWTGCTQDENPAPFSAQCMGKLSRLEGVGGIAPREDKILEESRKIRQGTGKCAHCLDKYEKSDRCYKYGVTCLYNEHDWVANSWGYGAHSRFSCSTPENEMPYWGCAWGYGFSLDYYDRRGVGAYAGKVCPQCGFCISNGKQSAGVPFQYEEWPDDAAYYGYYH